MEQSCHALCHLWGPSQIIMHAGSSTLLSATLQRGMPASLLMGCSSARLRAPLPSADSCSAALVGPVATCLAAGSPCIVANLWDVTDRDIDRFTAAFLSKCASSVTACQICTRALQLEHWQQLVCSAESLGSM